MAELANRMELESDVARRLAKLSGRHRRELMELLGNPPNPANIPIGFWKKVETEKKAEMTSILVLLFMASAEQHADLLLPADLRPAVQEGIQARAATWGVQRGATFASQYAANSAKSLESAVARLRGGVPDFVIGTVPIYRHPGLSFPGQLVTGDFKSQPTLNQISDELTKIFGPIRDSGIAATEVTGAATAGVQGIRDIAGDLGVKTTVTWFTERDGRVCPICRPLHGQFMSHWEGTLISADAPPWAIDSIRANGGPPAHPNCRCYLETKVVKQ
jgi:hypothetical protein